MRKRTIIVLALSAVAAMFAGPASAVVCYTLLEGNDSVLYRGYDPPVDMSAAGAAEREALRQKKQFLMVSYVDDCFLVSPSRWTSGSTGSIEQYMAGIQPFATGAPSGTPTSVTGATNVAPPAAPRAAPAVRSSSGSSSSTSKRGY